MSVNENRQINLNVCKIDHSVISTLSPEIMKRYSCIPFDFIDGKLCVALSNPNNRSAINQLRLITGKDLDIFYAPHHDILEKIKELFPETSDYSDIGISDSSLTEQASETLRDEQENSTTGMINKILKHAIRKRASDIHFEPQEDALYVRYRIDGMLTTAYRIEKALEPAVLSCIKVLSNMDISEKRLPQDNQFSIDFLESSIDFRVSSLPGKFGEKMVLRILDRSKLSLDLSQVGMDPEFLSIFEELIQKPQGLLLVTGPTGSGKTTTLYSVLNRLRSAEKNIITLEDPTEYDLLAGKQNEVGITQVSINHKIGMTFATGLRSALRQDPDIIMVGEIRDKETAEIAMKSSLTGHLVISTLHTNDSFSTLERLKDMGIEPYLVASTVLGIVAQRLVRMLCPHCKESYKPPMRSLQTLFPKSKIITEDVSFYRAKGCMICHHTGYVGRKGIYELLVMDERLMELIQKESHPDPNCEVVQSCIVQNLRDSGLGLVISGFTTIEEVLRITI